MKKTKINSERLEQIVLDLENDAENENYHEICPMYRKLAEILCAEVDDATALKIMKAVKAEGGFLP